VATKISFVLASILPSFHILNATLYCLITVVGYIIMEVEFDHQKYYI